MPRWLKAILWTLAALAGVLVVVAILATLPIGDADLSAHPKPARTYDEAVALIGAKQAEEAKLPLQPITHSVALLHGHRTPKSVVIFHGYTHSPYQWRVVAKAYYDAGYNVWIPLAPYHGYADRLTDAPSQLTAAKARDWADRGVDVAAGLGDKVEVVGLSTGGVAALWAAAARPDVSRTVSIAPLLAPKGIPPFTLMPLARVFRALPFDIYNWWTPQQAKMPGPAYPRFSFKGVFAFVELGQWVAARERSGQPAKGFVELVANWADKSVDTAYNVEVVRGLAPKDRVRVFEIPAKLGFGHDLVEPAGENKANIGKVYPVLGEALGLKLPDPRSHTGTGTPGL